MEVLKNISLFLTLILIGLSAGLFYAWEVSVIPGTQRVSSSSYLEVMQQINRAIFNPGFFTSFVGSLLFLVLSSYLQYREAVSATFWLLLAATITYLLGTFGVTALGNVPLNNTLDTVNPEGLLPAQLEEIRLNYERRWNKLHFIRTIFSMLSFSLALLAVFTSQRATENCLNSFLNP